MKKSKVLVSIICNTYNHEKYIRQCLEGFIMQKTTFSFEVLIHDDASTDKTADIIREYENKYPNIINPIYQTENQYSKGIKIQYEYQYPRVRGKYIALCEGDDYWIDPCKLQKQIDFLDANPEYSMCFHCAIEHFEHKTIPDRLFSIIKNKDYSGNYIFQNWIVPTASVVYRKSTIESDLYKKVLTCKDFIYGDTPLFVTCAELGKIRGMSDVMSVYRRNEGGVTQKEYTVEMRIKLFYHHLAFSKIFQGFYLSSQLMASNCIIELFYHLLSSGNLKFFKIIRYFKYINPFILLYSIVITPLKYIKVKFVHSINR